MDVQKASGDLEVARAKLAHDAEQESSPGVRQLPKLADHGSWDDGFGDLFATKILARLSNIRKNRMEAARNLDELLYAEMKKELEKPPFVKADPMNCQDTTEDATEGAKIESIAEQLKKMQDKIDALEQEVASVRDDVNFLYSGEE